MRATTILALMALLVSLPATGASGDDASGEKKRVVRVVTTPDIEIKADEDFIFVGDDGETVHLGAMALHRGGFIGVQLLDLTPELRAHFGVPEDVGVMISAVSDGGPAARAGVLVGDIVTGVGGKKVSTGGELAHQVRGKAEGDRIDLEVWRRGKPQTLTATIAERERPQVDVGRFIWKGGDENQAKAFEMYIDSLPENIIRIDERHLQEAIGSINEKLESPEWREKISAMAEERRTMETRIRELEQRLRELEAKLSKLDD